MVGGIAWQTWNSSFFWAAQNVLLWAALCAMANAGCIENCSPTPPQVQLPQLSPSRRNWYEEAHAGLRLRASIVMAVTTWRSLRKKRISARKV